MDFPHERTAVITGAGGERGIGRALARRLWDGGWALALVDIDGHGVRALQQELSTPGGPGVTGA